ncbi:hypothetical protein K353_06105 [Kitasatospora sp. SolWspMP-SS2h]|nr:hypothetical protein K353_06105 [Kitasatospora sp. SolWspMP-SS2h]
MQAHRVAERDSGQLQHELLANGTTIEISLGLFIAISRNRRNTILTARAKRLTELSMRWQ